MPVIILPCVSPIDIGRMVVLNSSFQAIQYDPIQHTVLQVIGVSYPKTNYNKDTDGWVYLEKDYWTWSETLEHRLDVNTSKYILNPNFDQNFNPTTDVGCVSVCYNGMAPFDKTNSTSPSGWFKIKDGTAYDLYIIK